MTRFAAICEVSRNPSHFAGLTELQKVQANPNRSPPVGLLGYRDLSVYPTSHIQGADRMNLFLHVLAHLVYFTAF